MDLAHAETVVEQILHVRLRLGEGLLISVSDVDRHGPANELRHDKPVQSLVGLAYIAEDPLAALCVTESLKVDVLVSRRPFDRLATPL